MKKVSIAAVVSIEVGCYRALQKINLGNTGYKCVTGGKCEYKEKRAQLDG